MKIDNQMKGMTLLETMLVLAVAASIILMGIKMSQTASIEKNYYILKGNVDILFQAMKEYYQKECDVYFSSDGSVASGGTLTFYPDKTSLSAVTFAVPTTGNAAPKHIPVVASRDIATTYLAKFYPVISGEKMAYVCSQFGAGSPICGATEIAGSQIVLWVAQIAVKMNDPTKAVNFVGLAGADCAVSAEPTTLVNCAPVAAGGDALPLTSTTAQYMIWQRMPSFSASSVRSSQWIFNPVVKQFKLQYTHDPMYELYEQGSTATSDYKLYKYYYCGG